MRRRLYFLLPNTRSAETVHRELLLAKIEERHMHVMAREDVPLGDLPEADLRQRTDLIRGLQLGALLGGLTGLVVSYVAYATGMIVPGVELWSLVSLILGGVFIGAFASTMIAINVANTRLARFKADIEAGRILFMVDVPFKRVDEISRLVTQHHPEADMRGIDPQIPAFP